MTRAAPVIRLRRLSGADPAVPLPAYASLGAAGADLRSNLPADQRAGGLLLAPGARALVPTGLSVELPEGHEWQIRARSGLALRHGLALANGIGTVDADYRGEVGVILVNLGARAIRIAHGDRIAQAVLAPVLQAAFEQVDTLSQSARGMGGFGSTGVAT
jgi:dUTP pyrophosphatase